MTALSQKMVKTVIQKINVFGEPVSFFRESEGEYDPSSGQTYSPNSQTFTGFGVPDDFKSNEINETTILRGDLRLYTGKLDSSPVVGDIVTLTSREGEYRVLQVNITPLSGQDVLYTLHLR